MTTRSPHEGPQNPFEELKIAPPRREEATLGEMETKLITASHAKDATLFHYISHGGAIYPNVHVPTTIDSSEDHKDRHGAPSLAHFQNKDQILIHKSDEKTLFQSFYDEYIPKFIHESADWSLKIASSVKHGVEICAYYVPPLQVFFSARVPRHLYGAPEDILDKIPARTFDWHYTLFKFAVALQDQSIYFYDLIKEEWSAQVLRHEFHRDVRVCRYKPSLDTESLLAVGTQHGICLWDTTQRLTPLFEVTKVNDVAIYPKRQYKDETQSGTCIFLQTPTPVTAIDWFPPTRAVTKKVVAHQTIVNEFIFTDMFVSGGTEDHRVMVWQLLPPKNGSHRLSAENCNYNWQCVQVLDRKNGGIQALSFSPNGHYLAVFTTSNIFRIWETQTWTTEKWSCFDSPVQCHCWSKNSQYLIVSLRGGSSLHVIKFDNEPPHISGQYVLDIALNSYTYRFTRASMVNFNRHNHHNSDEDTEIDEINSEDEVQLCGRIREISLDHEGGERLIVSFEDSDLLAVLRVDFETLGTRTMYLPVGYIKGPTNASRAYHLKFWPNFKKGSLLSVCYENGKIGFYPFYYIDQSRSIWSASIARSISAGTRRRDFKK